MTSLAKIVLMEFSNHATIEMSEFEYIRALLIRTQDAPAPISRATLLGDRCESDFNPPF